MKVKIEHLRFEFKFGRSIAFGVLKDEDDNKLSEGPISNLLQIIKNGNHELINAQLILDFIVRQNHFAS